MLPGKKRSPSQCQEPERTGLSMEKRPLKLEELEEELPHQKWGKVSSSEAANKPNLDSYDCPILPSVLYLKLLKEPAILDLQRTHSKDNKNYFAKKKKKKVGTSSPSEMLKASIFPATSLRIGEWERVSQCEGDLVAKFYFVRHKIVWEVLCGGPKNIIEIEWADIVGLKANFPENGPGSLTIVLCKRPLFFIEPNPQPGKHALWQPTLDFTDGNASRYQKHHLQCPCGVLNKHYEKLIQWDTRLNVLSQQSDTLLDLHFAEISIMPPDDA